jgi:Tfp pilus assembly protein PilN
MTQVNLLPTGVREKQKSRTVTAAVVAAGLGVVALLGFVYVLQNARLTSAQHKLEAQQTVNGKLQTQIAGLQEFATLKSQVAAGEALVQTLQSQEVLWSGVLRDVSMVIPNQAWLSSMTASINTASTASQVAGSGSAAAIGPVATIQFQGYAFTHVVVAQWLTRVAQVNGWVNAWLTSSDKSATGTDQVQWTGTIDLTPDATSNGGK